MTTMFINLASLLRRSVLRSAHDFIETSLKDSICSCVHFSELFQEISLLSFHGICYTRPLSPFLSFNYDLVSCAVRFAQGRSDGSAVRRRRIESSQQL